mmetsp:Transcript_17636/g.57741  ORF Transcript_17636/g.57741 Transcript_17636/m.57741 type:complete len:271 (-) Transcript_17636:3224-4036(-)
MSLLMPTTPQPPACIIPRATPTRGRSRIAIWRKKEKEVIGHREADGGELQIISSVRAVHLDVFSGKWSIWLRAIGGCADELLNLAEWVAHHETALRRHTRTRLTRHPVVRSENERRAASHAAPAAHAAATGLELRWPGCLREWRLAGRRSKADVWNRLCKWWHLWAVHRPRQLVYGWLACWLCGWRHGWLSRSRRGGRPCLRHGDGWACRGCTARGRRRATQNLAVRRDRHLVQKLAREARGVDAAGNLRCPHLEAHQAVAALEFHKLGC